WNRVPRTLFLLRAGVEFRRWRRVGYGNAATLQWPICHKPGPVYQVGKCFPHFDSARAVAMLPVATPSGPSARPIVELDTVVEEVRLALTQHKVGIVLER